MRRCITLVQEHQRWIVVGLLFLVAAVNNLNRQTLSVLAPTLQKTLGFDAIHYSYVISAFLAAYTLGYTFNGPVLDRVGVRIGMAAALGFWSLVNVAHAFAIGWMTLAAGRFLLGLGESFNSPASVKAMAEWVPPRERGLSMAVASNGNIFGAILAPPLVAALSLRFGWRAGFVVTGAIGLVILVIWWLTYDTPQRSRQITAGEREMLDRDLGGIQPAGSRVPMLALLRRPVCASFFVARFMTDSFVFFFTFWLPDYLAHGRGFTLGMIGMVGWLPYLAGDLGGPAGGAASDWLIRRGWKPNRARRSLMLVAACLTPFAALAVATRLDWLALSLIGLVYMAQTCWMANQLTLISESVSRENVATLLSLSALGGSLGGILSTLAIGRVIVAFGYFPVFAGLGALHLTAWLVIAAGFRREERISCMPTS